MTKTTTLLLCAAFTSFIGGAALGPKLPDWVGPPGEFTGHANAVEPATSIAEQVDVADAIVRARVVSRENRILTAVLPVYDEDGETIIDQRQSSTPFTDVTFEVLETLEGRTEPYILVLQTGGTLKQGPLGRTQKFVIDSDPLFEVNSEHILFLVDITGDGVHSTGRQMYRVVNPMGRYEVATDGSLKTPAQYDDVEPEIAARLPQTDAELDEQLHVALVGRGLAVGATNSAERDHDVEFDELDVDSEGGTCAVMSPSNSKTPAMLAVIVLLGASVRRRRRG